MRVYTVALGIYVFSLVLTMVNGLGIFQYQLPNPELDPNQGQVGITELTSKVSNVDESTLDKVFGGVGLIVNALKWMIEAFVTALTIIPLANKYQVPLPITLMFQGLIWFIYGFGIIQFLSGRGTKFME